MRSEGIFVCGGLQEGANAPMRCGIIRDPDSFEDLLSCARWPGRASCALSAGSLTERTGMPADLLGQIKEMARSRLWEELKSRRPDDVGAIVCAIRFEAAIHGTETA